MNAMRARATQHRSQRGFTLMEALISAWILSVGLLGLAAVVTKGMQSTPAAEAAAHAMFVASQTVEPLERLVRENPAAAQQLLRRFATAKDVERGYLLRLRGLDDAGRNLVSTTPSSWRSPLTVTLRVDYPVTYQNSSETVQYTTTRVFVR